MTRPDQGSSHPEHISRDEALQIVHQLVDAVNAHDTSRILSFYAEDAVTISPVWGKLQGPAAIANSWESTFSRFADWVVSAGDVVVDQDRIAIVGTAEATDRNGWFGQSPTGERIAIGMVIMLTMRGRHIIRDERTYDLSGVLNRLEKARLDSDLRVAADVQRILLPRLRHTTPFSETIADSIPCRAIGGDFFEVIDLPAGELGIALGDVAGKGPAAAILSAMLQGMFTVEIRSDTSPGAVLERLNRAFFRRQLEARFVTLVYAVLAPDGRLVYSNAGHNPPILMTQGGIRRLTCGGPILGAFSEAAFSEEALQLHPNDLLTIFSDGVTEANNVETEEFGEDRLTRILSGHRSDTPGGILDDVLSQVRTFCGETPQNDDITLAVTRFMPSPVSRRRAD
jgi:predicted ester cyclase